jgi:hypothetical protein
MQRAITAGHEQPASTALGACRRRYVSPYAPRVGLRDRRHRPGPAGPRPVSRRMVGARPDLGGRTARGATIHKAAVASRSDPSRHRRHDPHRAWPSQRRTSFARAPAWAPPCRTPALSVGEMAASCRPAPSAACLPASRARNTRRLRRTANRLSTAAEESRDVNARAQITRPPGRRPFLRGRALRTRRGHSGSRVCTTRYAA